MVRSKAIAELLLNNLQQAIEVIGMVRSSIIKGTGVKKIGKIKASTLLCLEELQSIYFNFLSCESIVTSNLYLTIDVGIIPNEEANNCFS